MTYGQVLKFFFSILVALAVIGAGYVAYRYWEAGQAAVSLGVSGNLAGFPPTVCTGSSGGFNKTTTGTSYILEGALRSDYTYSSSDQSVVLHLIVDGSGNAYAWVDGTAKSLKGSFAALSQQDGLGALSNDTCSPWWHPDPSLFQLPAGVTFVAAPSQSQ